MTIKILLLRFATGMCLIWLGSGCANTDARTQRDLRPRFQESDRTDLILRFNRWDTIHILRPDTREGGFLRIFTRENLAKHLRGESISRGLAVVVVPRLIDAKSARQYAGEWQELLAAAGFKRIVLIEAGLGLGIDGLPVVWDSAIGAAHDNARAARPVAALAPAAGAHVAHPSGD